MRRRADPLRDRWSLDHSQQVAAAFNRQAVVTPFPPLSIDGVEYRDFRGLPIREPLRDITIERCDLTGAYVEANGQLVDISATDCVFTGALLATNLSGIFRRCRFDHAVIEGATIAAHSAFSQCSFVKADLRNAKGIAVSFDRCEFRGANLKSARFGECEFFLCGWDDATFAHTMLVKSKITRAGFPMTHTGQEGRRVLPRVTVDYVEWLESPPLDTWPEEFERLMDERLTARRQRDRDRIIGEARAAYKQQRLDEAIAGFRAASASGPLDSVSAKMLELALRSRG